jgi:hypothetical protein
MVVAVREAQPPTQRVSRDEFPRLLTPRCDHGGLRADARSLVRPTQVRCPTRATLPGIAPHGHHRRLSQIVGLPARPLQPRLSGYAEPKAAATNRPRPVRRHPASFPVRSAGQPALNEPLPLEHGRGGSNPALKSLGSMAARVRRQRGRELFGGLRNRHCPSVGATRYGIHRATTFSTGHDYEASANCRFRMTQALVWDRAPGRDIAALVPRWSEEVGWPNAPAIRQLGKRRRPESPAGRQCCPWGGWPICCGRPPTKVGRHR